MPKNKKPPIDWKQRVADEVAAFIENNDTLPWLKPWSTNGIFPTNLQTKHEYQGINALLLGMMMGLRGYDQPYFLTINGMQKLGGSFTNWEASKDQGLPIVFWKMIDGEDKVTGEAKKIPLLRGWTVWNVAHMQGIDVPEPTAGIIAPGDLLTMEKDYVNPPRILMEPTKQAAYSPLFDTIYLPLPSQFLTPEGFGETKAHELAHSTGHQSRLARFDDKSNPHEEYAREELVAEIAAAIIMQRMGYTLEMRRVAAYIKGWASVIKDDPLMLISAANKAEKAANMVLGIETAKEEAA